MEVRFTEKHVSKKLRKFSRQPTCVYHMVHWEAGVRTETSLGRQWVTTWADVHWKQDFAAELWDGPSSGSLGWEGQDDLWPSRSSHPGFRDNPRSSVLWLNSEKFLECREFALWRRILRLSKCRRHRPFFRVQDIASGEGQGVPDNKHMALMANSGRHQLLKVTL